MVIAKTLCARAAGAAALMLLALPSLAGANPGKGPELVQRSGRLVVLHADRPDGSSTQQWLLVNGGRRLPVRVPADVWIDPGTPVRLEGTMRGGSLVIADSVTAVKRTGLAPLQADAAPVAASSNENTLVLLVSFTGGPAFTSPTELQATSLMFDQPGGGLTHSADSLKAYYLEQAYGQIAFSGTVASVTIPGPASQCGATSPYFTAEHGDTLYTWLDDAEHAAPGVEPPDDSAYKHVILALPAGMTCDEVAGAAGLAEVGGNHVWINDAFEVPVLAHEVGHNLGLSHAGGLKCMSGSTAVPMGTSCSATGFEYSDPFDAMGNAPVLRQMSMQHKLLLGVVPDSAQQVISSSGSYHVAPMETLSGTAEVLRLPKPGGGSYFVEYRRPMGYFDSQSGGVTGVYIRTESPEPASTPNRSDTVLIDMLPTSGPPSAPWADARLTLTQIFSDPVRGITIQDLAEDANGATLAITMPVDTTPPGLPGRLSAVVSGTSVALQWTPASDDFGVASYSVARDGASLGSTATTSFADSGLAPGSTVNYAVTATDMAGNVGPAATMSLTLPDTLAPSAPSNVTATVTRDGRVQLAWAAATDNVGVASYRVLRDGTGIAQPTGAAYVDTAPRPGSGSTVSYSVVAFDQVGNASPPGAAPPLRAALLRTLGASHLKVKRAKKSTLVRVTGILSDARAVCRLRLGRGAWHACKTKPGSSAFSVSARGKRVKLATLSLRDELGRVRQQTLRVP
jgi:hypothetical protein